MKEAVLRIAALLSYCGGPLYVADALSPGPGVRPMVFILTFLPVGLMVLGAFCLDDDPRSRWSAAAVWAGRQGLYVALGMHVYALWRFWNGARSADQVLHYVGIAIGVAWSVVYLQAAHRWESSRRSVLTGGPQSTAPIEPS